jgi:hypothetical protein
MWDGHSCPSLLMLVLHSGRAKIKTTTTTKIKSDGQECPSHTGCPHAYNLTLRRRNALVMTLTLLKLMAAAAKMGLSRIPKNG